MLGLAVVFRRRHYVRLVFVSARLERRRVSPLSFFRFTHAPVAADWPVPGSDFPGGAPLNVVCTAKPCSPGRLGRAAAVDYISYGELSVERMLTEAVHVGTALSMGRSTPPSVQRIFAILMIRVPLPPPTATPVPDCVCGNGEGACVEMREAGRLKRASIWYQQVSAGAKCPVTAPASAAASKRHGREQLCRRGGCAYSCFGAMDAKTGRQSLDVFSEAAPHLAVESCCAPLFFRKAALLPY